MKKLCRILIPGAFDGAICFLLFTYQVQAVESTERIRKILQIKVSAQLA